MSIALSGTEHSVVEVRQSHLSDWLDNGEEVGVDALILDLGSSTTTTRVVGDLRAEGRWIPILVVGGTESGWAATEISGLPGVDLLPLPLTPDRLQHAVGSVLRHARTAPARLNEPLLDAVPALEVDRLPELMDTHPTPAVATASTVTDVREESVPEGPLPLEPVPEPEPEPEPQRKPEPEPVTAPTLPLDSTPEQGPPLDSAVLLDVATAPYEPSTTPPRRERRRHSDPAAPLRLDPATPPGAPHPAQGGGGAQSSVQKLLADADSLYTLEETATVVVEDAVVRSRADTGALLVPDGETWRVAAGIGLRPLEYRLQLTDDAWLVQQIADDGKGILVEDSDVARRDLRGVPLASRTHLMAVPVPQVGAILLLARDRDEAFTETSLGALAGLANESGPLLQQALEVRALSRALARHLDNDDAATR